TVPGLRREPHGAGSGRSRDRGLRAAEPRPFAACQPKRAQPGRADRKVDRNPSVAAGAVELGAALELWLRDHPKADETQLRDFLAGWKPTRPVALAAPGLSPHGRA